MLILSILIVYTILNYVSDEEEEEQDETYNEPINHLQTISTPIEKVQVYEECFAEWSMLNEDTYFRRNLAFYYPDIKKIVLYLERRSTFTKLNLSIDIDIKFKNAINKKYKTRGISTKPIAVYETYSFESVVGSFELDNNLVKEILTIKCVISDKKNKKSDEINLKIKNFNNNLKNSSIICSDIYRYINRVHVGQLKWWIELNKMLGYSKIVIYENSIEDYSELRELLDDKLIEIIKFKCIPNLVDLDKRDVNFFTSFDQIRKLYRKYDLVYADHFEDVLARECYLENMDKYKFIAYNNFEESILPRYLSQVVDFKNKDLYENSQSKCNKNNDTIQTYFNSLDLKETNSFHFRISSYMKHQSIDIFFEGLEKMLFYADAVDWNEKKTETLSFYINNKLFDFKLEIKNEDELAYAKYLSELYKKIIKPFYGNNSGVLASMSEPFNRLFYIVEKVDSKPVINTNLPLDGMKTSLITKDLGHLSFFRKEYVLNFETMSISEFHFDMNYFFCFYLPMIKKFYNVELILP
jgi:hypothetical protein